MMSRKQDTHGETDFLGDIALTCNFRFAQRGLYSGY